MNAITRRIPCLLFLLGLLLFVPVSTAQDKAVEIAQAIDQFAEFNKFSGAVLVAEKGTVIYRQGIGLANREWNIPNAPDTRFQIGSVTKQFTALLVLQMVEAGALRLDDPITRHLPTYPAEPGNRITIHHLLSHTSGLPHYNAIPDYRETLFLNHYAAEAYMEQFKDLPLRFEPGTDFGYSSFGYYLLGAILETVSGITYGELLQRNIFAPLGMDDTRLDDGFPQARRATPYKFNYDVFEYAHAEFRDPSTSFATGGIFSTLDDLYRWDQALYTDALISALYRELLFTPVQEDYAYGWIVDELAATETSEAVPLVYHNGGITGYTANFIRFVEDNSCIIVLSNTRGYKSVMLPWILAAILYDRPYRNQRPLDKALHETIIRQNVEVAVEHYHDLKQSQPTTYAFDDENQLNRLGYSLIRYGRLDDALAIFHLNADVFPDSWNVYDSLGEAYLLKEDTEKAIQYLEQSLALNPDNTRAVEMLEALRESAQ